MKKIVQFITERANQTEEVGMIKIEEIPFSYETYKTNGWLQPFVVVFLEASYLYKIYDFLSDFADNFESLSIKIDHHKVNDDKIHACIEIMTIKVLILQVMMFKN